MLPVDESVRHWHASPRAAIGFLRHALTLDTARLGPRRCLSMPGVSATVGEEIEALRRAAGDQAVALIRREPDPVIQKIVARLGDAVRRGAGEALGFEADASFDAIIAAHVEDELGGRDRPRLDRALRKSWQQGPAGD